jgi:hypothetical protein
MLERIKAAFSSFKGSSTTGTTAAKGVVNQIVNWVISISRFDLLTNSEVYEQIYVYEADAGGGIDKIASMVANSYKYFYIPDAGEELDDTEIEMADAANSMFTGTTPQIALGDSSAPRNAKNPGLSTAKTPIERNMVRKGDHLFNDLNVKEDIEAFVEVLLTQGDLILTYDEEDPSVLCIQPNKNATFVDDLSRLQSSDSTIPITRDNYLIMNEKQPTEDQFGPGEFIHIRYKKTPVWAEDSQGRSTFGIYSISPLQRAILPTWQKRQMSIIDILYRWASIPKQHHKINSEMFALQKYNGATWAAKGDEARKEAMKYLKMHADSMKDLTPDQGITSLDTVTIDMIEPTSTSYVKPNEMINQLTDQVMSAINVPKSLGLGSTTSSFASELVLATYTSEKIIQLANKIKPAILESIKLRLLAINPAFPVDSLDIKIDHVMAISRLEMFRVFAIMVNAGLFTEQELRESVGYEQLRKDQIPFAPSAPVSTTASTPTGSPETPESAGQHITDSGKQTYKTIENKSRGEQV